MTAANHSDTVWAGPRPAIDRDAAPYWDGLRAHRIVVQRCGSCGRLRWPPRGWCGRCQSWDAELVELSGRGTVRSWIVVHRAHLSPFKERVPYVVVLVELDEQHDIVMPGAVLGSAVPTGGDAVQARFEAVDDDLTLLRWEVVGSGDT